MAVVLDDQALLTASPWLCLNATASCFTGVASALQGADLNPLSESDLLEALRLLLTNLPLVNSQPDSPAVRLNLCAAAFLYNRATDAGAGGGAQRDGNRLRAGERVRDEGGGPVGVCDPLHHGRAERPRLLRDVRALPYSSTRSLDRLLTLDV